MQYQDKPPTIRELIVIISFVVITYIIFIDMTRTVHLTRTEWSCIKEQQFTTGVQCIRWGRNGTLTDYEVNSGFK